MGKTPQRPRGADAKAAYALAPGEAVGPSEEEAEDAGVSAAWRTSLTSDEWRVLAQLLDSSMEQVYGEDRWRSKERARKLDEADSPHARFLLLRSKRDGALAAMCHYRFVDEASVPCLYLYELQVDPGFRRQRIGSFALRLLERLAAEAGLSGVFLTVQTANRPATEFYRSNGYVLSHHSPGYVDPSGMHEHEILCKLFSDPAAHAASLSTCRGERKRFRKAARASSSP